MQRFAQTEPDSTAKLVPFDTLLENITQSAQQLCSHEQARGGNCASRPLQIFYIFEALEVQAEDVGQLLDFDALLSFLKAAACIAAELVLSIKRFCRTACKLHDFQSVDMASMHQ